MDNKQDKQFYWEVKDFLNRKPTLAQNKAKPETLKESIQKMLVAGNSLYTPKVLTEETNKKVANELSYFSDNMLKNVNSLLSLNEENIRKNTPECKAFTANNPSNIFSIKKNINLNEAPAFGSSSGGERELTYLERRKRERDEEDYVENRARLKERQAAEREQLATRTANIKARQEQDKISSYQKDLGDAIGGPLAPEDEAQPGESFDDYQTRLGSTKRGVVGAHREAKRTERVAGEIAGRVERLSAKKPEELTAQENSQLMMDRIMMQGKSATPGLEGKVKEKLSTSVGSRMEEVPNLNKELDPDALSVTAQQEIDMAAGKTKNKKGIESEVNRILSSTTGRSVEDLRTSTQTSQAREQEQRDKERAQEEAAYKESQYQKMRGERIGNTRMTYGEFEDQTGRRYDALNKDDSSLVSRLAGAGRYSSEEARQTALTTDQFNRRYSQQNVEMARRQGQADRKYDETKFEADKFRNDPAYREAKLKQEREAITNDPKFKADIEKYKQQFEKNVQSTVQANKQAAEAAAAREIEERVRKAVRDGAREHDRKQYEEDRKRNKPVSYSTPENSPDEVMGPPQDPEELRWQAQMWRSEQDDAYENKWREALGMEPLSNKERRIRDIIRAEYDEKKESKPATYRNLDYGDYARSRRLDVERWLDNEHLGWFKETGTLPGESVRPSEQSSPSLINSFTAKKPVSQSEYIENQIKRLRGERVT